MMVTKPMQVDHGYFEFRVNWDADDLMGMSGDQLERLQSLVADFERLEEDITREETP